MAFSGISIFSVNKTKANSSYVYSIGNFRFMELPREVRDNIYSYLLQPLIYTNGIKDLKYFAVTIQAVPITKRNSCILMRKVIAIFHQLAGRHDLAHYPNRFRGYFLQASPLREVWVDGKGAFALCDTLYLNWIRRATYTSSNFRLELQQLLWERVGLKCINMDDLWVVPTMLTDRPAILGSIKYLGISINAATMPSGFNKKFFDWCVWMSRNVELETFRILLRLRETQLNIMAEGGGPIMDLLACRMLTVTGVFKLICSVIATPNSNLQPSKVSPGEREQRWDIYSDKIRSLLMPDTLRRHVGPLTEMEQYTGNRI